MNSAELNRWCGLSETVIFPPAYRRRPLIMGILNVTPDSFSDGGRFLDRDKALQHADDMVAQGADLLDIGGESSRPGAMPVSIDEELTRVIPVIEGLRARSDIALSIDTCKPEVMRAAVEAGASLINDIQALQVPGALAEVARLNVPVCLMHMQGRPEFMQVSPSYETGVISAIQAFFSERILACVSAGIPRQHLILDPGFGFGKTNEQNLFLTKHLLAFQSHGLPLLFGVSRKNTIGSVFNHDSAARLAGGLGLAVFAALQGVSMIRTHDVDVTQNALRMLDAVVNAEH